MTKEALEELAKAMLPVGEYQKHMEPTVTISDDDGYDVRVTFETTHVLFVRSDADPGRVAEELRWLKAAACDLIRDNVKTWEEAK